jgi:hypothetical protein
MGVTGWVRDRAFARPRSGDGGHDFVGPERSEAQREGRQNGGAPSSLTQPQSPRHTWQVCERNLSSNIRGFALPSPHKPFSYMGERVALSLLEGTNGQRKVCPMARSKVNARDALRKVQEQRERIAVEEARLRESVAAELGAIMLECNAETLEPAALERLMLRVCELGIEETMKRISP